MLCRFPVFIALNNGDVTMNEVKYTRTRVFKVWWSVFWRIILYSATYALLVGLFLEFYYICHSPGADFNPFVLFDFASRLITIKEFRINMLIIGSLSIILGSFVAVWLVLGKQYKGCRLTLVYTGMTEVHPERD